MKSPQTAKQYFAAFERYNREFDQIAQARRQEITPRQRRQLGIDLRQSLRTLGKAMRGMNQNATTR